MKKWVLGKSQWDESGNTTNSAKADLLQFFEVDFSGTTPKFTERNLGKSIKQIVSAGINEGMISGTDDKGDISFYAFPNVVIPYSNSLDTLFLVAYDQSTGKDEVFARIAPEGVCGNSIKETEIIKRDGTANQYYFLYKTACINNFPNDNWKYVIVDVDKRTISSPITLLSETLNEGMAVSTYNCAMNNRWLFFVKYDNGNLLVYRSSITSTGISSPVLATTLVIPGNSSLGQGDIEISPLADKIAIANYTSSDLKEDIAILDFDIITGSLSNLRWINNTQNYMIALEFSPDGNHLYSFRGGTSAIISEMYNIPVPTSGDYIISSSDRLNVAVPVSHSIEIGYDGKLYFTLDRFNSKLYCISNPNESASNNIISTTPDFSFGIGNGVSCALPDQIDGSLFETKIPISILPYSSNICKGESVQLKVIGATSIKWSGGISANTSTITVSPQTTTTYYLDASNGCNNYTDTIIITVIPLPHVSVSGNTTICKGETTTLTASGATSYQWTGGINATTPAITVSPQTTTTYYLDASTSCSHFKDTIIITVIPPPNVSVSGNTTICKGETTTLTASGATGYQWSGGSIATTSSIIVSPNLSTIYYVIGNNGNCYSQAVPVNLTVNSLPYIKIVGRDSICSGDTLEYSSLITDGTPPYTHLWSNGSTAPTIKFSSLSNTSLGILVSDKNGCKSFDMIPISIIKKPQALFTCNYTGCTPIDISLFNQSKNANQYKWIFGDGTFSTVQNPVHTYNTAGMYTISLIASNHSCWDTLTIKNGITVFPAPQAGLSYQQGKTKNEIEIFNLSSQNSNCILYYGDGDSLIDCQWKSNVHIYPKGGEYTIMQIVTNAYGCRDTVKLKITIEEDGSFYYPNSFTPNADGVNDIFQAYGVNVSEFKMSIFNRWGELLFQSDNLSRGWDGQFKGSPVEQDVYVLKIEYLIKNEKIHTLYDRITLVK